MTNERHQSMKQLLALVACVSVGVAGSPTAASAEGAQPNILFLLADDQCFETIGALGHTQIETPNLDRLVRHGTTFTHAYNMGSWSVDYLGDAQQRQQPFFMYVAFNAPHDPRQSPKEYVAKYPLERIDLPKNFLAEYPYKDEIGCSHSLRDEKLGPMPRTGQAVKVHRQEYYALITHLDAQIGRILDALEKSGQAENTWIFFTADHGLAVGHHGLFGKQNMYDHSVRVPFIVVGPGVARNRRVARAIYLQDVMPTTLELAELEQPKHVFFHSLLPLLRGDQERSLYESVYGAYLDLQRAITYDGWKLIAYPEAWVLRLYHLDEDPLEMTDLASDARHATRKIDLFQRLLALQKELNDRLDLRAAIPAL